MSRECLLASAQYNLHQDQEFFVLEFCTSIPNNWKNVKNVGLDFYTGTFENFMRTYLLFWIYFTSRPCMNIKLDHQLNLISQAILK